ncbi:MAG TPA: hypothetical protein PLN30_00495, partial [Ferruginibacter sp.]|nr:hypothetical protein [Ferruginibacter sp.]
NAANKVLNVAQGAANFVPGLGPVVSAVIKAIQWIVQKLGGGKDAQMTAQDMPDLQGDLGNSIDYGQLNQDYGNVNTGDLSETATELINNNANYGQAQQVFQNQYPQMSQQQVDELATQTQNGYTPITEDEAGQFAWDIKNQHQNMTEESIENSGG